METLFICLVWMTIFVLPISILVEVRRLFAHRTMLRRGEAIFAIVWECLFLGGLLLYATGLSRFLMMLMFICTIPIISLWLIISIVNNLRNWNEKRKRRILG